MRQRIYDPFLGAGTRFWLLVLQRPDQVCWPPIHENGGIVVVFLHQAVLGSADFNARVGRHCLSVKSFPSSGESKPAFRVMPKATKKPQLDVSHAVSNLVSTPPPVPVPA